jgi:hypothetical protein
MNRNERDLNDADLHRTGTDRLNERTSDGDTVGDEVGEAAGGISGVLAGAALGSLGGPLGTIIGGLAGAVSGWWAGRAISEAASKFTHDDDAAFRTQYESSSNRLADRSYDDVRPAYQLGHLAGRNPEYANRSFDEVETDLQRGWTGDVAARHGDWSSVRSYARDAYERGRGDVNSSSLGAATTTGSAAYAAGHTADRVDDATDRLGDRTENAAHRAGDKVENAWDKTKAGAERLGGKLADAADDVKDRVDGNPASRPGVDSTDRRL